MKFSVLFAACLAVVIAAAGCSLSKPFQPSEKPTEAESIERLLSIARIQERQGKTAEAVEIYNKLLEREPTLGEAHHRLGVIAAANGDFEKAKSHFRAAQRSSEPSAELLSDIGYTVFLMDDLAGAEQLLRQAISLSPQSKVAHNNLGRVLAAQGRYDEAMRHFVAAQTDAEAFASLAYLQAQQGDLDLARANYHRALEINPELRPAAEALIQLAALETGASPAPRPAVARAASTPRAPATAARALATSPRPAEPGRAPDAEARTASHWESSGGVTASIGDADAPSGEQGAAPAGAEATAPPTQPPGAALPPNLFSPANGAGDAHAATRAVHDAAHASIPRWGEEPRPAAAADIR